MRHARVRAGMAAARGAEEPGAGIRVRGALRELLLVGRPTMEAVAREMAVHPRTLGRRLKADGLVFDDLRDEVRAALALALPELTDLPVSDIAATLSCASPEVFAESFRRMRGMAPREWRAAQSRAGWRGPHPGPPRYRRSAPIPPQGLVNPAVAPRLPARAPVLRPGVPAGATGIPGTPSRRVRSAGCTRWTL